MRPLSIYIHIPFCPKKCLYCDFTSFSGSGHLFTEYTEALLNEIKVSSPEYAGCEVKTIFFGGGTPTLMPAVLLGRIMDGIFKAFKVSGGCEVTFESNPETMDIQKAKELALMGANRLSFGVQAFQDRLLRTLGRVHTVRGFMEAYEAAINAGFSNINADLMFSLPGQSLKDWEESLERAAALSISHISCYGLIIEEGTPFYSMRERGEIKETDEDTDRQMYYMAEDILSQNGFRRYEISNFCKKGFECRHNIVYWQCGEYAGFGTAAHSYFDGVRFSNTQNLNEYIRHRGGPYAIRENNERLTKENKISEFMFMGLRLKHGIDVNMFEEKFKTDIYSVYKDVIPPLVFEGLLEEDGKNLFLTKKGTDISNYVFEKFVL